MPDGLVPSDASIPASVRALVELFDGLPHVLACVKRVDGTYLAVNGAFAERVGRPVGEIVGRRAGDIFDPELAESYERQDAEVLASGRPVRDQLEVIVRADRTLGWYVTSKVRVDDHGVAVAIATASVDVRADVAGAPAGIAAAVKAVRADLVRPWKVGELAVIAGVRPQTFERLTHRIFGVSPRQLLSRLRMEHALHLLRTTTLPIGTIASAAGFYDQSRFTRHFKQVVGVTPGTYRARLAGGAAP